MQEVKQLSCLGCCLQPPKRLLSPLPGAEAVLALQLLAVVSPHPRTGGLQPNPFPRVLLGPAEPRCPTTGEAADKVFLGGNPRRSPISSVSAGRTS